MSCQPQLSTSWREKGPDHLSWDKTLTFTKTIYRKFLLTLFFQFLVQFWRSMIITHSRLSNTFSVSLLSLLNIFMRTFSFLFSDIFMIRCRFPNFCVCCCQIHFSLRSLLVSYWEILLLALEVKESRRRGAEVRKQLTFSISEEISRLYWSFSCEYISLLIRIPEEQ